VVTGLDVLTAYGRGRAALRDGVLAGEPAFGPVTRFDVSRQRVGVAAQSPGDPDLTATLVDVVRAACAEAGLGEADRADVPLLLARHADPATARLDPADQAARPTGDTARKVAAATGLHFADRTYSNACVAASSAVADAAAMISLGRRDRVVVAAGYLVDADNFALFDAGRALAVDGRLRSFSAGRKGLLLGDGVGAVVLESATSARSRGVTPLARVDGWGRAGDAYHVCQPDPAGGGMARAIEAALRRAALTPADLDYVNAHGTGTPYNDSAESAALHRAFGDQVTRIPVSSTKSLHGHTLEASGLVELAVSVNALHTGVLPANSGYLGPDEQCRLPLVLEPGQRAELRQVLSMNAAFGGANTALVLGAVSA
jgi:3-oxoacyl-(acyl-carrier-protein) synthase